MNRPTRNLIIIALSALAGASWAETNIVEVGKAWAKNSVNANILRYHSVVSDKSHQYIAYYDEDGRVVLGKREIGSETWELHKTQYGGNVRDAHNSISIMVDGASYLHMSWDHHAHPLRYARGKEPGSLELSEKMQMTGIKEDRVTYPEFYKLSNGNLLFFYRDGLSGRGNLMINHYDVQTQRWTQRQDSLLDGEGQRNAYWQTCTDSDGTIHISWVWRETGDVATNHNMGYAKSKDEGRTWLKSSGEAYELPITAANAEYAALIPQKHELINTTGMCADGDGRPYIATFWRPPGAKVPQYHLIYHDGSSWHTSQISDRKTSFSLSGGGTKRKPISRPRIVADSSGSTDKAYMIFRDNERGNRVSVAICDDLAKPRWTFRDLTSESVGMWEPSFDTEMWERSKILHIYMQQVGQGDGETVEDIPPTMVSILEWKP